MPPPQVEAVVAAVVAVRSVTSSYQVAVENRVVVEEEIEAITTGPVKKANPFPAKATSAATPSTANGTIGIPLPNSSRRCLRNARRSTGLSMLKTI